MPFPSSGGSGSGTTLTSGTITQTAHALVVGNIIRFDGTNYVKAQANNAVNSEAIGIVTSVIDANNFTFSQSGLITGLTGLTPGQVYFLSDATAGLLTATEPTAVSSVSKPLFEAVSATSGYYTNMRGNPALGQTAVISYGENTTITTGQTTTSSTLSDIANGTISIPSAGTWEIGYLIHAVQTNAGQTITMVLTDNNNVIIPSTTSTGQAASVSQVFSQKTTVITTGAATYKVRWSTGGVGTATILNSSTGVLGTASSKTWYEQIGASPVPMDLVGEYGENTGIVDGQTTASTTYVDVTGGNFTLPSAGTWQVNYNVFSNNATGGAINQFRIVDSSNIVVANSVAMTQQVTGGTVIAPTSNSSIITTTGASTYKLQWVVGSGTNFLRNNAGISLTAGNSKITWRKISGFIPSSGQTVDYINVRKTTTTTVSGAADIIFDNVISGNIPYNTTTGLFTLTAGITYDITTMLRQVASLSACDFSLVDSTNVILPNSPQGSSNANTSQGDVSISFVYTPTTNIQIKLRNIAGAGTFGGNQQWVTIKQIGSSAVIAGVYPGTWTNYIPTIGSTGASPTLATTHVKNASYSIQGKTMFLNWNYFAASATGATGGTGVYIFPLPAGYVIDLTKAIVPTIIGVAARNGVDGLSLGNALVAQTGTVGSSGKVVAIDSTSVGLYVSSPNSALTGNGNYTFNTANMEISFSAQIPIL